jgi:hypothetical protein
MVGGIEKAGGTGLGELTARKNDAHQPLVRWQTASRAKMDVRTKPGDNTDNVVSSFASLESGLDEGGKDRLSLCALGDIRIEIIHTRIRSIPAFILSNHDALLPRSRIMNGPPGWSGCRTTKT